MMWLMVFLSKSNISNSYLSRESSMKSSGIRELKLIYVLMLNKLEDQNSVAWWTTSTYQEQMVSVSPTQDVTSVDAMWLNLARKLTYKPSRMINMIQHLSSSWSLTANSTVITTMSSIQDACKTKSNKRLSRTRKQVLMKLKLSSSWDASNASRRVKRSVVLLTRDSKEMSNASAMEIYLLEGWEDKRHSSKTLLQVKETMR